LRRRRSAPLQCQRIFVRRYQPRSGRAALGSWCGGASTMRGHSREAPDLSEKRGAWRRKIRTDLVEHEHEPLALRYAPRTPASTSRLWYLGGSCAFKHEQYGGEPVDDLLQRAHVEPLQLLFRLAAPGRCLPRRSAWRRKLLATLVTRVWAQTPSSHLSAVGRAAETEWNGSAARLASKCWTAERLCCLFALRSGAHGSF
jgi:hypothetical protein